MGYSSCSQRNRNSRAFGQRLSFRRLFCVGSTGNTLVVVESPAKVDKIKSFLGSGYDVVATYGHIRQIKNSPNSVKPDKDFQINWGSSKKQQNVITKLTSKVKTAKKLILATDPDREGEAISWHVQELMNYKKVIQKNSKVERITFTEITKPAVQTALKSPRSVDQHLVDAYMARNVLDYLVGYTLSPVLWRRLKGCKSAGRVQSSALKLVVSREHEILEFEAKEYWDVQLDLKNSTTGLQLQGKLTHFDSKKLQQFDIVDKNQADFVQKTIEGMKFKVVKKATRKKSMAAPAPFTTSSLQQAAFQKLNLYPNQTMAAAQSLYEEGLVTYMRTDGTNISQEAINSIRQQIQDDYPQDFLPDKPNVFAKKAKNAQEAHEAIRVTSPSAKPQHTNFKNNVQKQLYELIWQRTLACQMTPAIDEVLTINLETDDQKHKASASGTQRVFTGWSEVYQVVQDDDQIQDTDSGSNNDSDGSSQSSSKSMKTQQKQKQLLLLQNVKEGDVYNPEKVAPNQHFTKPPPRYNDASLVKSMEQLGIGRPSTYASILAVLKDRGYIISEKRTLKPTSQGRILSTFLTQNFHDYVDYKFTSRMESKLDEVANGQIKWKGQVLQPFWNQLYSQTQQVLRIKISDVISEMNKVLSPIYLKKLSSLYKSGDQGVDNGTDTGINDNSMKSDVDTDTDTDEAIVKSMDNKNSDNNTQSTFDQIEYKCPQCKIGDIQLVMFSQGSHFSCSRWEVGPCDYKVHFDQEVMDEEGVQKLAQNGNKNGNRKVLGKDPKTNLEVVLKQGPFGWYIQLGEKEDYPDKIPPRRVSLGRKFNDFDKLSLDSAMQLLKYPVQLGTHSDMEVYLKKGPFGFYVQIGESLATIPPSIDLDKVAMSDAIQLLEKKVQKLGVGLGEPTSKKKLKAKQDKEDQENETTKKSTSKRKNQNSNSKSKNTTNQNQENLGNKTTKKSSSEKKKLNRKTKKASTSKGTKQQDKEGSTLVCKKSNWMVFLSVHSKEVAEKENLKPFQVMKLLGERWRGMTQQEKSNYEDKG